MTYLTRIYRQKDFRVAITGGTALIRDRRNGRTIWLGKKGQVRTSRHEIKLVTFS